MREERLTHIHVSCPFQHISLAHTHTLLTTFLAELALAEVYEATPIIVTLIGAKWCFPGYPFQI